MFAQNLKRLFWSPATSPMNPAKPEHHFKTCGRHLSFIPLVSFHKNAHTTIACRSCSIADSDRFATSTKSVGFAPTNFAGSRSFLLRQQSPKGDRHLQAFSHWFIGKKVRTKQRRRIIVYVEFDEPVQPTVSSFKIHQTFFKTRGSHEHREGKENLF